MQSRYQHVFIRAVAGFLLLLALRATVFAQGITTSAISGFVTGARGQPIAGATVKVVHEPSGTESSAVTRANGEYDLSGLRIGGPYAVTVTAADYPPQTRSNVMLEIGEVASVNVVLGEPEVVHMQAVTVAESRNPVFDAAKISTGSSFTSRDVENVATVRRNVQDIAALDSRLSLLNLSNDGELSAQGQNYRYNSFLVDNVQTNDPFGLNANGFASLRSPVPFEALQAVGVELNPYEVRRSGFTGALINAVTKSGTNQFSGMGYIEYTDQNMREKNPVSGAREAFRERTYGGVLGGPIIPNRLFFFLSYDDFRRQTPPPTLNLTLDPTQVSQIVARAKTFNYEPGDFLGAQNLATQKTYLAKIDWNIAQGHRLSVTYRRLRGEQPQFPFFGGNNTSFSNYWYDTMRKTDSYTAQLFSNWTPDLRTEATFSTSTYDGSATNHGTPFPQVFIQNLTATRLSDGATVTTGSVDLGTNSTYQLNTLKTRTTNGAFNAEYSLGAHTLIAGADLQRQNIADNFISNALGSYTFRSLADWLSGTNASFTQTAIAPGKTAQDTFGNFAYTTVGAYLQDSWKPSSRLTITGGVRFDVPYVSKDPTTIPTTATYSESAFQSAFGMASTGTNSGNYIVAPRVGFNYKFDSARKTQIRGGVGLFQGTNPAVWISNAYQNRGLTNSINATNVAFTPNTSTPPVGAPAVAAINLTDPAFHSPAVWKENLALDHELPFGNLTLTIEVSALQTKYAAFLQDLNLKPSGINPDGRIRYAGPIVATSTGNGRGSNGNGYSSSANYLTPGFADVFELTNTSKGGGHDATVKIARPMKDHWAASLSWTHSSYNEVSPMTATGNAISFYNTRAVFNPNENVASKSNYNIPDRIVGLLTYRREFLRRAPTTVALIWQARSGRPYSWVFSGDANGDGFTSNDLLYVPTGPDDPRVRWNSTTERDNFFAFVNSSTLRNYLGTVVPRNSERSEWVETVDIKLTQSIPLYRKLSTEIFANLLNVGNMLNDKWGLVQEVPFSYKRNVVGTTYDAARNQYVYTFNANTFDPVPVSADAVTATSRWQVQVGMRVRF